MAYAWAEWAERCGVVPREPIVELARRGSPPVTDRTVDRLEESSNG